MQLQSNTLLQGGKYRIEKVLGQGGFGITYLGTQKVSIEGPIGQIETEIQLAIKEFFMKDVCNREEDSRTVSVPSVGSQQMAERFKQKFIKEAWNISKLKHPHIVKVVDVFEENGTAYYVMEYHGQGSLNSRIKKHGAFSEKEATAYILQIADALSYVHGRQMNHLDVKPDNVLLNNKGEAVLIDFGLSKCYDADGEQTSSTPIGVSVGYAPLEQSRVGGVGTFSPATDIYSLGATFYKLVTGKTPPEASEVFDEGLPEFPDNVNEAVQQAIYKAMEPQRKKRPQSIEEFVKLLGNVGNVTSRQTDVKEEFVIPVETVAIETPVISTDNGEEETIIRNPKEDEYKEALSFLRSKGVKELGAMTAVDLGLSVKWANCNIGSKSAIEKGDLLGWGDALGEYTFETNYLNKRNIPNNIAGTEFDIVTNKMGPEWQMPTVEMWEELFEKCSIEWLDTTFLRGFIATGRTGEKVFFPAAGYRDETDICLKTRAYYYTANKNANHSSNVYYGMFCQENGLTMHESSYYIGRSIRGVKIE